MGKIIDILVGAEQKGSFLELITEDIFNDLGLLNVSRQKSGSQYGFDVIGYKDNQCWKAECKNLSSSTTIADIAPKIIWHIDSASIDKFIIVAINGISNDLQYLLEKGLFSFSIEIWYGNFLEKIISSSPKALRRLGLDFDAFSINEKLIPLFFAASKLKFHVHYSKGLPYAYDYFFLGNKIIKAYSEIDFRLVAILDNSTHKKIIVQEIIVKTLQYQNTERLRVLRQYKQKGIVKPLRLTFNPKENIEGIVELNNDKLIEIKEQSNEYIEFKLSNKCTPGYYELIFEINCIDGDESFSLYSPVFSLHKKSNKNDIVSLCIIGKYYDTPVNNILNLSNKQWQLIKKELPNYLKYLGPTINDIIHENDVNATWKINVLKGKRIKDGQNHFLDIKSTRKSELLLDLEIPIEEDLYIQKFDYL